MKFTLNTLGCPSWTLEQAASNARAYGYQGVDIRLIDGEVASPALVRASQERILRLFSPEGLPVPVLATSVQFSSADESVRARNEAELREFIALAAALRIPALRVYGGQLPAGVSLAQAVEWVAEHLNRVAPVAEDAGVTLGIETHDEFSAAATVADVLQRVPSRAVGAVWDMLHTYKMGESPADVWRFVGERVINVHLKDARRNPQARTGWDLVLLGEGEVPVRDGLRLLREQGYAAFVSVEWEKKWHPHIPEPEIAFPQHLAVLHDWLRGAA